MSDSLVWGVMKDINARKASWYGLRHPTLLDTPLLASFFFSCIFQTFSLRLRLFFLGCSTARRVKLSLCEEVVKHMAWLQNPNFCPKYTGFHDLCAPSEVNFKFRTIADTTHHLQTWISAPGFSTLVLTFQWGDTCHLIYPKLQDTSWFCQ